MEAPRACELQPMRDASWAEPREAGARERGHGHRRGRSRPSARGGSGSNAVAEGVGACELQTSAVTGSRRQGG